MSDENGQTVPLESDFEHEFHTRPIAARGFVQWNGTDVCLDVTCPDCKNCGHVHGYFAYHIKCSQCGAVFVMNPFVPFHRVTDADRKNIEPDDGNTHEF